MSRSAGDTLPPAVLHRLDAGGRAFADRAIPLCTVDPAGYPHVALLSNAEIVARTPSIVHVALYAGSGTSANLRRTGRCTLLLFDEGLAVYVKAAAIERGPLRASGAHARFELRVLEVLIDSADRDLEGDGGITSGIGFTLTAASLARRSAVRDELGSGTTG